MASLVLHVGLSKTATTTLQHALFAKHPQIKFLGKHLNNGVPKGCLSQELYDFLLPLIWKPGKALDLEKHRRYFSDYIEPLAGEEKVIVASWEGLANLPAPVFKKVIQRLLAVCADIKVIFGLRKPTDWVASEYLQQLQHQYLHANLPLFRGRPYLAMESWLEKISSRGGGLDGWLSYTNNIRESVALLGAKNVGVFVFEQLKSDQKSYYSPIASFLSIDVNTSLELVSQQHYNPSLSLQNIEYFKFVDASLVRRLQWLLSTEKKRRIAADMPYGRKPVPNDRPQIELPEAWVSKIIEVTGRDHVWINEQFELDLSSYGYTF